MYKTKMRVCFYQMRPIYGLVTDDSSHIGRAHRQEDCGVQGVEYRLWSTVYDVILTCRVKFGKLNI